ncbi:MAG: type 1 glutamine amidotransferase [Streptomyces sp.]|uniref:type 1 glutamine amidotransferase n=1 Tax=Streptomyces sp. TaxID=1931 RepID=UPI003D6C4D09
MGQVLVVQNTPDGGPRRFGTWLRRYGLSLDVVHAYAGDPLPARLTRHQALVVLGGGYMPDADDRAAWLAPTRALAGEALETGVPVFGICLGAQLLAHVAGGTVRAEHGRPEAGSTALTLRPETDDDALFHGLPAHVTAIEHRVDAITDLPPDAHWLVRSERCPVQAFRVGESAWGVQFHPEATAQVIHGWDPQHLREQGFDHEELIRAAERDEPASTEVWSELTRRFAAVVTAGTAG